jgi:ParB family transcriptional regulator, chromosome partitioning protein
MHLVLEKLEADGEAVSREGWKWVEVYPEYPYSYTQAMRRVYPQSIPLGEEERAKLDALIARYDALTAEHGEEAYLRVGMLPFDS